MNRSMGGISRDNVISSNPCRSRFQWRNLTRCNVIEFNCIFQSAAVMFSDAFTPIFNLKIVNTWIKYRFWGQYIFTTRVYCNFKNCFLHQNIKRSCLFNVSDKKLKLFLISLKKGKTIKKQIFFKLLLLNLLFLVPLVGLEAL